MKLQRRLKILSYDRNLEVSKMKLLRFFRGISAEEVQALIEAWRADVDEKNTSPDAAHRNHTGVSE